MAKQTNTATADENAENAETPEQARGSVAISRKYKQGANGPVEFNGTFPVPETAQAMIDQYGDDAVYDLVTTALATRLGSKVYLLLKDGASTATIEKVVSEYDPAEKPKRGRKADNVSTLVRKAEKLNEDQLAEYIAELEARRAALAKQAQEGASSGS